MQIFNLNIFNNQNTSFKKANTAYKALTKLPKTPCACCGAETITTEELDKFWSKVTRPLSKIIIEGKLDYFKNKWPEAWGELATLAVKYPKESLDKILSHDNLFTKTAIFFQKLIESREKPQDGQTGRNLLLSVVNNTRKELRSSSVVMREAEKFENSINEGAIEVDKDIFKQLKIYAQKFPRMKILQIIQQPEIYKNNKQMSNLLMAQIIEEREFHYNNILKLVPKVEIDYFKEIEEQAKQMLSSNIHDYVKRNNLRRLYTSALKEKKCEHLKDKIFKELDGMKMNLKTKESFFSYSAFKKYSDNAIIGSILDKHINTFEHVLPRSKGGQDSIHNGIVMCQSCNLARGNESYTRLAYAFPQMPENLSKQMKFIIDAIEKKKMSPIFDNYPIKITPLLDSSTNHVVKLNETVNKYAQKVERRNNRLIKKNKEEMANLSEEEKKLKERLDKIKADKYNLNLETQHALGVNGNIKKYKEKELQK